MESNLTTIEIKKTTRDVLKELGNKGDTYDSLLNKMIKEYSDNGE